MSQESISDADTAAIEAEFDAFSALCERLQGFGSEATAEYADGYLTAMIAGPNLPAPTQFIEKIFGDSFERAHADPESANESMQVLMRRWNRIAQQLLPGPLFDDPDALTLIPLMQVWDDEMRASMNAQDSVDEQTRALMETGAIWATGFMEAVADADWEEPPSALKADAAGALDELLRCVAALYQSADSPELRAYVAEGWKDGDASRDELINEALYAVQELRLYWLQYPPKREPIRADFTPGRNELCFCGSGKKYKKCHGAAPND
jgi:uncharacterized protein